MVLNETPPKIEAAEQVTVRYSLGRGDIFRAHLHQLMRNRVLVTIFVLLAVGMACLQLKEPHISGHSAAFKVFFVTLFSFVVFTIVTCVQIVLLFCLVLFRKQRGLLGEHELQIREEGLWERTDVNETLNRWVGFHKVYRMGGLLFVYVTDTQLHIVPRRSFSSEELCRSFQMELERRVANAKQSS